MSVRIAIHRISADRRTCAHCKQPIPNLTVKSLTVPHQPGEFVGLVTGNHFNPVPYRPNPAREHEDPCT